MFCLREGDVVPGVGIGVLKLGMSFEEVRDIVKDFNVNDLSDCYIIECDDVDIWVNKEKDKVTQILVKDTFAGLYAGTIGIGSTLADVKDKLQMSWHDEYDVYILDEAEGMGFELGSTEDEDDWDELTAPIEYMFVFLPEASDTDSTDATDADYGSE